MYCSSVVFEVVTSLIEVLLLICFLIAEFRRILTNLDEF